MYQVFQINVKPIHDGSFQGCLWMGGKKVPITKTCHTYPTMMKLGTVTPYVKKTQKMYESRNTSFEFCGHQHLFTRNEQILLYQETQIQIKFCYVTSNYFQLF